MTDTSAQSAIHSPWTFDGESAPLTTGGPTTTLVEGRTFAISTTTGDITPAGAQGLFFLDTRLVSRFEILLDGEPIEALGVDQPSAYAARFVGRHMGPVRVADAPTVVVRHREIALGMTETVEVRNYGDSALEATLSALVEVDFAGLFQVKEGRVPSERRSNAQCRGQRLWFTPDDDRDLAVEVEADTAPSHLQGGRMDWAIRVEPGETVSVEIQIRPWLAGDPVSGSGFEHTNPKTQLEVWNQKIPVINSDHAELNLCMETTLADLASLRIFDPATPDVPVVAAGAPWFMTLFGRDSLIASWMALIVDPDLAVGVLQTLARFQGTKVNPATDEEPGKIMHEIRFAHATSAALDSGELYYGTADATPLFVMLLAEAQRWGVDREVIADLLPHADRALAWITDFGDADGDGYVEYHRSTETGLANQGWKDSWDGIRYGDGRVAEAPIALCEVQAYVYGAYRSRARLAEVFDDAETSAHYEAKAAELRARFNQDFWLEDSGWLAVGLDGDKNPIDSLTTNVGHAMWAGIVDIEKVAIMADRLVEPDMFTGWGLRTLSSENPGYNPTGYHVGSVWPHDTALVMAGLMRYGFEQQAHRLMMGLVSAGAAGGGRLPELMAGFDRSEFATPIAYPASCSPQAWAAAAPLLILRWLLRFDPWTDKGRIWIDPILPDGVDRLSVSGIRVGEATVSVEVDQDRVTVEGIPDGISLKRGLRLPCPRRRWEDTERA